MKNDRKTGGVNITLRPAASEDALAIARVHIAAWQSAYRNLLPAEFLENLSLEARRDLWQSLLNQNLSEEFNFVAEREGVIVGFANCGPARDLQADFAGELQSIYLLDEYRGMGIGTRLFQKAVDSLRSCGRNSMFVWVLKDNPYRSFYERRGGVRVREKGVSIAGTDLIEVAYGWRRLGG